MSKYYKGLGGIAVIALLSLFFGDISRHQADLTPQVVHQQSVSSNIWSSTRELTSQENAHLHFKKHGAEFGFKTEQDYIGAAINFTSNPTDKTLSNIQHDGDRAYFNPATGEFAVKTPRGKIRTYFKLDPKIHGYKSNTDYFNAQARGQKQAR